MHLMVVSFIKKKTNEVTGNGKGILNKGPFVTWQAKGELYVLSFFLAISIAS